MKEKDQEHLINWGYAVCDYAIRTHLDETIAPATKWPYARGLELITPPLRAPPPADRN